MPQAEGVVYLPVQIGVVGELGERVIAPSLRMGGVVVRDSELEHEPVLEPRPDQWNPRSRPWAVHRVSPR